MRTNMDTISYLEYRLARIESNIEFFGSYAYLPNKEKEEYKRIKEYFKAIGHNAKEYVL